MTEFVSEEDHELGALLPFYINGTLRGDELDRVEAALANNPELQQELQVLHEARRHMQAEPFETSPGELGLARLKRDIAKTGTIHNPRAVYSPWVAFAAGAIAASFIAVIVVGTQSFGPQSDTYTLATGGQIASGGQNTSSLLVKLNEDVSVRDVTVLLQDLELNVISGPSARGFYYLQGTDDIATSEAFQMLEAHSEIFEYLQMDVAE